MRRKKNKLKMCVHVDVRKITAVRERDGVSVQILVLNDGCVLVSRPLSPPSVPHASRGAALSPTESGQAVFGEWSRLQKGPIYCT